jgi:hypothetical protein
MDFTRVDQQLQLLQQQQQQQQGQLSPPFFTNSSSSRTSPNILPHQCSISQTFYSYTSSGFDSSIDELLPPFGRIWCWQVASFVVLTATLQAVAAEAAAAVSPATDVGFEAISA